MEMEKKSWKLTKTTTLMMIMMMKVKLNLGDQE